VGGRGDVQVHSLSTATLTHLSYVQGFLNSAEAYLKGIRITKGWLVLNFRRIVVGGGAAGIQWGEKKTQSEGLAETIVKPRGKALPFSFKSDTLSLINGLW